MIKKKNMSKEFLKNYMDATAPTGNETEGQRVWVNEMRKISDDVTVDSYGTAVAVIKQNGINFKVGIEAHCDEIGWQVNTINDCGSIRVVSLGGSDTIVAPSKTVTIHTHDGKQVKGVFGSPAIHTQKLRGSSAKGQDQQDLWIDIGFDTKERVLEAGVEVGNLITFNTKFDEIGDYYVGKALDDKIGGYIIASAARVIKERGTKLPFDLYVINSVQEEVGCFGAERIAKALQLDMVLCTDVTHNTNTPKVNKDIEGDIKGGEGPCIDYTAQNHKGFNAFIRKVAKDNSIPVQLSAGHYGNDTLPFFLENTVTSILSMPLKYMHTTVEMAHKKDVKYAINLMVEVLECLNVENIKELIG